MNQNNLKNTFRYDAVSGFFYWLSGARAGNRAGYLNPISKHIIISFDKTTTPAHKLAYLYMTGEFPPQRLMLHYDRDRTNNSWENIKPRTRQEFNLFKEKKAFDLENYPHKDKYTIIFLKLSEKYRVLEIGARGLTFQVGLFDDIASAIKFINQAEGAD